MMNVDMQVYRSKVILFQEALQYCYAIVHCYIRQIAIRINVHVLDLVTWHVAEIVVDILSIVITTYVLNQSHGHWLLNDALHSIKMMNTKLMEEL
jgi:hypothetical protein